MKISVDSINRYLKSQLSTERMVELLLKTEVEVEEVLPSSSWDEKIITARVDEVRPHPDADRLRIAIVNTGSGTVEVVCGAPNLAEKQVVVLAQVGSVLPDGLTIEAAKLRGVESHGMLCSAKELGVSDDHSGIMLLPDETPLGKSLCDIWQKGDCLDIKTPANRWDYLSLIGLAREVAARDEGNELVLPVAAEIQYSDIESVDVKEKGECRRFIVVKMSVNNAVKSPQWLVDNLEGNGIRSISPVVDITNFVMLETGQPSHAYDATKLHGDLAVRFASPLEKLTTLDGAERTLSEEDLVIADDQGAIGIAGVMGGARTEVDTNTTEILLEIANFDRTRVRKAAIRHGLRSEASARFERSLPLPLPAFAAERLVVLLQEVADGKVVDSPTDQLYGWPWVQQIGLRLRKAEKILGVALDEKQVVSGLKRLGFEVEHFSITKEARKHLGKPYIWGANFKQHGESGFDCSYLVDRIYSRIGVHVGHVALGQYHHGWPVEVGDLRPGDVLFYTGLMKNSPIDHYYTTDADGKKHKHTLDEPEYVGHNGIYVGNNTVVTAIQYERKGDEWVPRQQQGVIEVPLTDFTNEPTYLGARRYVENFNHILAVTAPWWRTDVRLEEDMVEEIVKIIGYDAIPAELPTLPPTNTRPHRLLGDILELKRALAATGLQEVVTYSFISARAIERLGYNVAELMEVANPLSQEQQYLRSSILPSHLDVVRNNQGYAKQFAMFEISRTYRPTQDGELPIEDWKLAVTTVGKDSLLRLKGALDNLNCFTGGNMEFSVAKDSVYSPGRCGKITLQGDEVGLYGQLSKAVVSRADVQSEVSYGEVLLSPLLEQAATMRVVDLPDYQIISRDISMLCNTSVAWSDLEKFVTNQDSVQKVAYLGLYQDDVMQRDKVKNLTVRISFDLGPNPTTTEIQNKLSSIEQAIMAHAPFGKVIIR